MEDNSLTANGWIPALKGKWRLAVRKAIILEFKGRIKTRQNKQYFAKIL